jgi:hypothetical protein
MAGRRRWDTDTRGIGVADARAWRPTIDAIAAAVEEPGWVAEEPDLHLLPHLEAAVGDGPLAITGARVAADGTFEVALEWIGPGESSRLAIRSALCALVASIAETVTVLHEPPAAEGRALEVLSGKADDDGPFAGHGHLLRFTVTGPPTPPSPE